MGIICFQAAVLGIFLPETKGKPTLETMDDMEKDQEVGLLMNGSDNADKNLNQNETGL